LGISAHNLLEEIRVAVKAFCKEQHANAEDPAGRLAQSGFTF
jgi:hypothetical protein